MKVYLIQHGLAISADEDPERPLSQSGVEESEDMAACIASKNIGLANIFHSSKLRAKETAQIFAAKIHDGIHASEKDGLAPKDDPVIWKERLDSAEEDVMIVGHLPHLAGLASLLLCGDSEREVIRFRNSGVVCIERDEKSIWRLSWAIDPDIAAKKICNND